MRILAIDTATEACSVALLNDGAVSAHFEECPREHTQRILPGKSHFNPGQHLLNRPRRAGLWPRPRQLYGRTYRDWHCAGAGAGRRTADDRRLYPRHHGTGRMAHDRGNARPAAIDARMGEVYWAEYTRDEQGVWHGEETEAVLKPEAVTERLKQLSGEWATVGTGWQAWPEMANGTGLTLVDGNMLLPAAEDMLPIASQLLAAGKTVAVEHAEPVYLRNTVAWKKLPGRE